MSESWIPIAWREANKSRWERVPGAPISPDEAVWLDQNGYGWLMTKHTDGERIALWRWRSGQSARKGMQALDARKFRRA